MAGANIKPLQPPNINTGVIYMNFDEEKLFDDEKWESDYPNFITIRVSDIMLRQLQIMKEDMYYSRSEVIREAINYYYRHYYLESLDNENFH